MQDSERSFEQLEKRFTGWEDPRARLAQALEKNELDLYAQPIIDLRTSGDFPIAEVLVRLREEDEPLMAPSMFLPAFEYCGMMPELDLWVARQVVTRLGQGSRVPCLYSTALGGTPRRSRRSESYV